MKADWCTPASNHPRSGGEPVNTNKYIHWTEFSRQLQSEGDSKKSFNVFFLPRLQLRSLLKGSAKNNAPH